MSDCESENYAVEEGENEEEQDLKPIVIEWSSGEIITNPDQSETETETEDTIIDDDENEGERYYSIVEALGK